MFKKFIGNKQFYKNLLLVSIPIILSMLITQFVSLLDNLMVGMTGAETLKELMRAAVTEGTASKLFTSTYTAYGKTGSAEFNDEKGKSHSWFTGFAEANGKTVVATIIVEGAGSGSEYAVPIAGKLFSEYFTNE